MNEIDLLNVNLTFEIRRVIFPFKNTLFLKILVQNHDILTVIMWFAHYECKSQLICKVNIFGDQNEKKYILKKQHSI